MNKPVPTRPGELGAFTFTSSSGIPVRVSWTQPLEIVLENVMRNHRTPKIQLPSRSAARAELKRASAVN